MGSTVRCRFIDATDSEWSRVLACFPHDIYHTSQFLRHSAAFLGGHPTAALAEKAGHQLFLPLVTREIPHDLQPSSPLRDAITPQGYGGFLCTPGMDEKIFAELVGAFVAAARSHGIVSVFVRQHPLWPARFAADGALVEQHGETVAWYLAEPDRPLETEMRASHRNEVRWLRKHGYQVVWNQWEQYSAFQDLYTETMGRVGATAEYRYTSEYFASLKSELGDSLILGTVIAPDKTVAAAALFFECNGIVQYHLSGSHVGHQRKSPTKLLITECAAFAKARGAFWLHLGGGVGSTTDALFKFKSGFSSTRWRYSTIRMVTRPSEYRLLVERSHRLTPSVNLRVDTADGGYFPAYRSGPPTSPTAVPPPGPCGWPRFSEAEIDAVSEVLRSGRVNYWTGREIRKFEEEYAQVLGVRHAIALTNGTAALELALHGLGIGPGDEVIVPSRTFIASASAVVMRGATPVIADIDRVSQNITADSLAKVTTERTKAVIVVHVGGWPCAMDEICAEARRRGLFVIEDCAQAHGALLNGRPVGTMGDAGAFSFCQDKIITTGGEGGLLVTNNSDVWERAWSFKDHGKNWGKAHGLKTDGTFRYLHDGFGTNLRMTEMQAAIGRIQLQRLRSFVDERRHNAKVIRDCLADCPGIHIPIPPAGFYHSYYRLYASLEIDRFQRDWSRDRVVRAIASEGYPIGIGSCGEIYRERAFDAFRVGSETLPNAARANATSVAFLVHPGQTDQYLFALCSRMRHVLSEATASRSANRKAA